MFASGRGKSSKKLAQLLVCLLLFLSIPSYSLDLRCSWGLDPCLSIDCCNDCKMSAPAVERGDQTPPKFEAPLSTVPQRTTLVNIAEPKTFEYPFLDAEAPIRPPRLREPSRGPPA